MAYKQSKNPFSRAPMSFSPLKAESNGNNDPGDTAVPVPVDTKFATNLAGKEIAIERESITPGKVVEKQADSNQSYLDSFVPGYNSKVASGDFTGSIEDYRKSKEQPYEPTTVTEVRDYTKGLITRPGEQYEGRFYKEGSNGNKDEAYPMGDFLAMNMNKRGDGGDPNTYITANEAWEHYKKVTDPRLPKSSVQYNFNNWRKRQGLEPATFSVQKGYKPTTYTNKENLTAWQEKQ